MSAFLTTFGITFAVVLIVFPGQIPDRVWWPLSIVAVLLTLGGVLSNLFPQ